MADAALWLLLCIISVNSFHVERPCRASVATWASETENEASVAAVPYPLALGGDFCGWSAEFELDGRRRPIPEHWIPESLLEWGQEPSALEVILSEDATSRQIVTVLPSTGCAVDNMETIKSEVERNTLCELFTESVSAFVDQELQLEAIFAQADQHRIRVEVGMDSASLSLQNHVRITLERQVSDTSSGGTIADGGGLDGQRVSRMLGDRLRALHSFALQQPLTWKEDTDVIVFPGNVTLASQSISEGLVVEIGLLYEELGLRQIVEATVRSASDVKLAMRTECL